MSAKKTNIEIQRAVRRGMDDDSISRLFDVDIEKVKRIRREENKHPISMEMVDRIISDYTAGVTKTATKLSDKYKVKYEDVVKILKPMRSVRRAYA